MNVYLHKLVIFSPVLFALQHELTQLGFRLLSVFFFFFCFTEEWGIVKGNYYLKTLTSNLIEFKSKYFIFVVAVVLKFRRNKSVADRDQNHKTHSL